MGKFISVKVPHKQVVSSKEVISNLSHRSFSIKCYFITLYHLRVEDDNCMMEYLNFFNTLVSQLVSIDIKMDE